MTKLRIHTLDLNFQETSKTVAAFLVEANDDLILVESGPYSCYDALVSEVSNIGFSVGDIKHLLLTHIHFDHAGAAWKLAESGTKIYVHPFGAKHLIDPGKLLASAKMIYKDRMDELWGEINPIDTAKVRSVEDREKLVLGNTSVIAHHTPGHARHHICWQFGDVLFSGDVAGVKIEKGPVMPPCPPPDIDIEAWIASLRRIISLSVSELYLTHFGLITEDIKDHCSSLEEELSVWSTWIKAQKKFGRSQDEVVDEFSEFVYSRLSNAGLDKAQIQEYELANPAFMSVAGLYHYWNKREA